MRARCVNNKDCHDHLTLDKEYDVERTGAWCYTRNDKGYRAGYFPRRFEVVDNQDHVTALLTAFGGGQ